MKIKHFILDLDGTLWNTTEVSAMAYNQALKEDGRCSLHITPELIKKEFGKTLSVIADDLFPEFDTKTKEELMDKCDRMNTAYLRDSHRNMLYPGVRETLAAMAGEDQCRLYMVSNCQKGYIEMFLEKYHLESYITDKECYGNNGNNKADNIKLLMKRGDITQAVYVGDTAGDYESATAAGIPFIFASYGYGTVDQSTLSIEHFSQLRTMFEV